jgi:hypothetical protein
MRHLPRQFYKIWYFTTFPTISTHSALGSMLQRLIDEVAGPLIDEIGVDLSAFRRHGGKMIVTQGKHISHEYEFVLEHNS